MRKGHRYLVTTLIAVFVLAIILSGITAAFGQEVTPAASTDPGVVEALIWEDTNGNGVYDEPLVLIDGVKVNLYRLEDNGSWTYIDSKVSGPGAYGPLGFYQAPPVGWSAGWVGWNQLPVSHGDKNYVDYVLEMEPPAGYCATGAGTVRIGRVWAQNFEHPFCWWRYFYLEAGNPAERSFSLKKCDLTGEISGHKWYDCSGNGAHEQGEPGVAGVIIKLSGTTTDGETVALETKTGDGGSYAFKNLKPGAYTVSEVVPTGWEPTSPASIKVNLAAGQKITDIDFNNKSKPSCISGHKWKDCNANGKHDCGEPGLACVTIKLNGTTDCGETVSLQTKTVCGGVYYFKNLKPGKYTVSEVVPCGWQATSPASVQVTLGSGQCLKGIDFNNLDSCTLKWIRYWSSRWSWCR